MQQLGYNLDYDKLALRLNISPEEILRMTLKNDIKETTATKFETILGIDKEWLLYGIGKPYKPNNVSIVAETNNNSK